MENRLSTNLSMDLSSHVEMERTPNRGGLVSQPPDINVPFAVEPGPPRNGGGGMVDVSHGSRHYEAETHVTVTKVGKKCAKRLDTVWGAFAFFSFCFKPVLNENSRCVIVRDGNGVSGYGKTDLKLDVFMVQHDMENMYMWAFKEKPENALGKMQLRSYMNGHCRQGEKPFPFSAEKGFIRSHRMQRKHYRGLSNPQCIHGIQVVCNPYFSCLSEEERKKWMELSGRELNFSIPPEASDFSSWRTAPVTELEIERPLILKDNVNTRPKGLLNGSNLSTQQQNQVNEGMDLSADYNKRRKNYFERVNDDDDCSPYDSHSDRACPQWVNEFSGVMRSARGPVTAAKTIYEDDNGFLIIVSLPFSDLQHAKVTWRNTNSHGIVKISCVSTGRMAIIKRQNRTFKLTDATPEHCPPGEFIREIALPSRIPEDARLEAFGDETGTMLEINVPKHPVGPEEHEVRVCLRASRLSELIC